MSDEAISRLLSPEAVAPLGLDLRVPTPEAGWTVHKRVHTAHASHPRPVAVSPEHVEARWVTLDGVEGMLRRESCRTAFRRLLQRREEG